MTREHNITMFSIKTFSASLKPMQLMQLHWTSHHSV